MELTHPTAAQLGCSRLYHFEKFCPKWLAVTVREQRIHCSNPATPNDPWDCRPRFDNRPHRYNPDELMAWSVEIADPPLAAWQKADLAGRMRSPDCIEKFIDRLSDHVLGTIAELRVYCLTWDPCSTLMWSHYANNHRGICLEFDTDNPLFDQAQKVDYSVEYPLWLPHQEMEKTARDLLMTKSVDWKDERQFRILGVHEGDPARLLVDHDYLALPPRALKSVIVGCEADYDSIRKLVNDTALGVSIKRAVRVPNHYRLEIGLVKKTRG
jgi:hypothetical protein